MSWEQLQGQLEHERWLEENCPHGVPKDSGKFCLECAIDSRAEPDPIPLGWHEEYNQYLQEQEQKDERITPSWA